MRWRSSDWQPAQRGIAPLGEVRPFGPAPKTVPPQIGHMGAEEGAIAVI
jgi:hypothetical protein